MKKYATWALIVLAIWWAVQDPTAAAHFVHGIGGAFTRAASSLSTIASGK